MTEREIVDERVASGSASGLSRRGFIKVLGAGSAGAAALSGLGIPGLGVLDVRASDAPVLLRRPTLADAPPVEGLHLGFGADPTAQMIVSWQARESVLNPRVRLGTIDGGLGREVTADVRTYTDTLSGQQVWVYSAALSHLSAGSDYIYAALHDGAEPEVGTFRTAPKGRVPFTFTSFGDLASPGTTVKNPSGSNYVNDALGSPFSTDVVGGIERHDPLFHLINGDLCYANLSADRLRVWETWWANVSRSSRHRPWMPAAGNHENERGNGPIGYTAYQTYFSVPSNGGDTETLGLWYAFTVGNVRFISLANDDACIQDGGNTYVRGYSGGAQRRWLETELARARSSGDLDWIVVCMHQCVISTANNFNGADLGLRQQWVPLFDQYGVDLVVFGHEHHYERSHPIRGQQPNDTLTPIPVSTRTDVVDTSKGTVHLLLGGGGTSVPSNGLLFDPPQCRVIVAVGPPDPVTGKRPPVYVYEPSAPWSAVRDAQQPYGFGVFTVDPGSRSSGVTSMSVEYHEVVGPGGQSRIFDSFTLQRPRGDAGGARP